MLYLIDSANTKQIEDALALGAYGVTANTSMYRKEHIKINDFMNTYANTGLPFFSIEVCGTYDEMLEQAKQYIALDPSIIIKINFSKDGLKLVHALHTQGVRTALTLVFTVAQAMACINSGVDFIFYFIGRNEETGKEALTDIHHIQTILEKKHYNTKLVAASIKHLYHLQMLAIYHIDYAAIPYDLYIRSLDHPLTISGSKTFIKDYFDNQ